MNFLSRPLRRLGVDLPDEFLDLLRHGRGVDNRRLKQAGFEYRFTSAGTVADFVESLRIRGIVDANETSNQNQPDRQQFNPHTPAVVRDDQH
jgi:UDP-glucose 4-epimerase